MTKVKQSLKQLFLPNMFRGHAVMLSSFITGNIYLMLLTSGFAAAIGLIAGLITAPIGLLVGAATLYIIRKAVNIEFKGLRKEASHQEIELTKLPSIKQGDLLETSKKLYTDTDSWKAALISLAKFPVGIASLVFISVYLSMSISLIISPLIYRSVDYRVYGTILNTPAELALAVSAGIIVFVMGANLTEKASKYYLKLNSLI